MSDGIPRPDTARERWQEESLKLALVYAQGATANINTIECMEESNKRRGEGQTDLAELAKLLDSARMQRMLAVPLALTATGRLHYTPIDIERFLADDPVKHETYTTLRNWRLASELATALANGTMDVRSFEIGCNILYGRVSKLWLDIYNDHNATARDFWLHETDMFATELLVHKMLANNVLAQAES